MKICTIAGAAAEIHAADPGSVVIDKSNHDLVDAVQKYLEKTIYIIERKTIYIIERKTIIMKIIGYSRNDFVSKEGRPITGCRIYLATEVDAGKGEGVMVKDMYLSDAKMAGLKINLHDLMGREVKIYYNEFRKPESIVLLD